MCLEWFLSQSFIGNPKFLIQFKKAKRSLHALNLIRLYFTNDEMWQLVTSYFYLAPYYNSEIWHIPTINHYSKQQRLLAFLLALKLYTPGNTDPISFTSLHKINNRATLDQLQQYKHSLLLYGFLNHREPRNDWLMLNISQTLTYKQTTFHAIHCNNFKVGNN